MSFTEVASLDADVVVALGKKDKSGNPYPKQAEGYYLGARTVENKRGPSQIFFLQTVKGNLGIWSTTDLARKLAQVPVGTMVRITSTGTKTVPTGEMYTYKVEIDSSNAIEVSAAAANTTSNADGGFNSDADEEYIDEGLDTSEDEEAEALANAAAEAAARKAKVQSMLAKRNTKN